MTRRYQLEVLAKRREIVPPPAQRSCDDHSFEMPTCLYGASAALLFGFVGVTSIGFATPGLIIPIGIIIFFLGMFFAIPTLFVRRAKGSRRALSWSELMECGIDTATGPTSGREAAVLVLILPLLIFCWGVAVVAIAALV